MYRFRMRDDSFGLLSIGAVILISIIMIYIYPLPIDPRLIVC